MTAGSPGTVRRGLVLGGGGMLGAAWMVGALCALEEVQDFDLRDCDYLVGTSAGAVLAALLGGGASTDDLRRHQLGELIDEGPLAELEWDYGAATGGSRPGVPHFVPGSTGLIARNVHRLRRMPRTLVLSALLPEGRRRLDRVGQLVEAVTPAGQWSDHPGVWVVATDYESGERVVFGRPDAQRAGLSDAVRASCAIPGWYAPIVIDGHRFIDGGAWSATNVDLLADLELDEVYVIAPMVSFALDSPRAVLTRLERRWRVPVTKRCLEEASLVNRGGAEVTILGPGPEDLSHIGGNVMDVERRRHVVETSLRTSREALRAPTDIDGRDGRWPQQAGKPHGRAAHPAEPAGPEVRLGQEGPDQPYADTG